MNRHDITASLRKAGSSQAKIARELGVTAPHVCAVVRNERNSSRVRKAISRATGLPIATLWPKTAGGARG